MGFLRWNGIHIDNPEYCIPYAGNISIIIEVTDMRNFLFESLSIQNHDWAIAAKSTKVISNNKRVISDVTSDRHQVRMILALQLRFAKWAPEFIRNVIRPKHLSGSRCGKFFHLNSSFPPARRRSSAISSCHPGSTRAPAASNASMIARWSEWKHSYSAVHKVHPSTVPP